uniref:DUF8117 domain-containing protein n=1 Tax=Timema tahoe TaxID=61484 RepID=A0A7R9IAK5_9NEOP|nr:unnamed protein product [Timema tahoe]
MWQDQPPGFWVRCVISFRSFMWQRGLVDDAKFDDFQTKLLAFKRSEDAFCNLVTFLTGNKISAVCAFIEDTSVVASNHHQMIHILDSSHAFDPFYNKSTRSAFRSLFGDPTFKDSLVTMVGVIDIYLHFAMVLIKILKRWLTSEEKSSAWKPPSFFLESDAPYIFEGFLKERFGKQLFELIGVQRDNLSWWDKIDMEQAQILRQRPNPQVDVVEGKLLPWQMGGDDPELGAGPDLGIKVAHLLWMYYSQSPFLVSSTPEPQEESLSVTLHEIPAFQSCYYIYYSIFGPRFHSSICKIVDSIHSKYKKKMVEEMNKNQRPSGKKAFMRNNRKQINDDFIAVINSIYENRTYSIDKFIRKWEGIYNFSYSFGRDAEKNLLYICMDMPYLNTYLEKSMNKLLDYTWKSQLLVTHRVLEHLTLEYNFIPFKMFPILKELHQPLERILVLFKETKLLLRASIALMEEIQRLEGCDSPWLSRLKYHKELHHILPKFDQSINKLGQLALRLLDTLLQQAWSKQERKTGRCNPGRTRVNPRFHNLGAVPDLERLFVDNHRHLVFWLNMDEVPDMNKRHTHFKEVYKILKDYLAKMLDKEQCKKWDSQVEPIDDAREFTEVEEMIFAKLKLTSDIKDFKCQRAELYTIVKSLTEDSYLDEETAKQINNWLKKLNLPGPSGNSSVKNDNRLKDVIYLQRVGNLYILAKSIINIYPFPRNKRNSFNQIFQDECNHLLLASACKFVRSVQEILNIDRSQFVPCPPPKCFQAIQDFMYKFSWEPVTFCPKDIVSGLDEFRSKLWANTPETRDKDSDNDKDMDAGKEDNDSKASSSIDVMPYLAKVKISSIDFWTKQKFNYWINVFEGKLFELMKKVADKYFELGENYSEVTFGGSLKICCVVVEDCSMGKPVFKRLLSLWSPGCAAYSCSPKEDQFLLQCAKKTSIWQFPHWHTLYVHLREELAHIRQQIADDKPYAYQNKNDLIRIARLSQLTYYRLRWIESEVDKWCAVTVFVKVPQDDTCYCQQTPPLRGIGPKCSHPLTADLWFRVWNEPLTLCDPDAGDYAHHDMRHARLVTLALLRFHVVSYYIYLTVASDEYLKNFQHSHRLVLEDIVQISGQHEQFPAPPVSPPPLLLI